MAEGKELLRIAIRISPVLQLLYSTTTMAMPRFTREALGTGTHTFLCSDVSIDTSTKLWCWVALSLLASTPPHPVYCCLVLVDSKYPRQSPCSVF